MFTTVFLLGWSLLTQVQPDQTAQLAQEVDQLVRQLDHTDRQAREQAEQQLIELGEKILPLLPPIDATTPAEVKDRLTRVRQRLEREAAQKAAQTTRLTLQGPMTLAQALAAIQQQTGNRVVDFRQPSDDRPNNETLTLDLEDVPFWPALDQLMDQLELTIFHYAGEYRALALVARPEGMKGRYGRASYSGPFRIAATEVIAARNLNHPSSNSLRLQLEVLWEPRLLPIVIRQPFDSVRIIADDGSDLPVAAQGAPSFPVQSTVTGIEIYLPATLPDRSVRRLKSVSGTLSALVPGHEATFEFENLEGAVNVRQQRAGLTVILERVRAGSGVCEARLRLQLDQTSPSLESHLDWASNNQVYLVAPDGTRSENPNFEKYLEREREVGFTYVFPLEGSVKGYRLVCKSPVSMTELPVEYELTDIELP